VLRELRVENLLLIEQAQLRLAPGLNVITGETGAGKTVLAHALDLLLGGRARPGIVRPGTHEAYVEGAFDLSDAVRGRLGERLGAEAEEIVLGRRVGSDGRTRAYLNGRSATVAELRDVGAELLSFYGQHEHRRLTISAAQLQLLDELCGAEHALRLRACAEAFAQTGALARQLEGLRELASARERELDLLEYELAEIDSSAVDEAEHEELLGARERLRRVGALCSAAGAGAEALAPDFSEAPGAVALLAGAAAGLDALGGVDPRLDELGERLRTLVIESQDLAAELRDYGVGSRVAGSLADGEPAASADMALQAIEERLEVIDRLARKHGGSIQAVLDHATLARARREELAGAEVAMAEAEEQLREARVRLEDHVEVLRLARQAAAPRLTLAVREQLASLAMGDASFEVVLAERGVGPFGGDAVEFLIAPNPGVPAGPVREIASGGELSRVMLALITACRGVGSGGGDARLADASSANVTLVFDEVDAGIGGHTARAVGARLRQLGEERQLLCITHLPQIASLGDRHFSIVKDTSADPTLATVVQLGEPDVVSELVRMLGADSGDSAARRHARDLRRAA
jgi:DNA repair protein RecN (Recombination protein N)